MIEEKVGPAPKLEKYGFTGQRSSHWTSVFIPLLFPPTCADLSISSRYKIRKRLHADYVPPLISGSHIARLDTLQALTKTSDRRQEALRRADVMVFRSFRRVSLFDFFCDLLWFSSLSFVRMGSSPHIRTAVRMWSMARMSASCA